MKGIVIHVLLWSSLMLLAAILLGVVTPVKAAPNCTVTKKSDACVVSRPCKNHRGGICT